MIKASKQEAYPLSPMQLGMLFHSLANIGSDVDIQQIICGIHEHLDIDYFQQAWRQVVNRHSVLQSKFDWEETTEPTQIVMSEVDFKAEYIDWRHLPQGSKEENLEAYFEKDRKKGFDLGEAPLMRLAIFRLGDEDYKFIWTFHHILLDGRAFPLILEEVFEYYHAFSMKKNLELAAPRPFKDYVTWVGKRDLAKDEEFWREHLKGFTSPTSLVVGTLLTSETKTPGNQGIVEITIDENLTSSLRDMALQYGLTLNTLIEGAWAMLLARYNDEEDIVYGTTRSCRRALEGAESMIGLLINTIPMRVRIQKQTKMIDWLKKLREQHAQMREYLHPPLYEIQRWSDIKDGTPLFESLVVFENYYLNSYMRAKGGKWLNREFEYRGRTNYPVTLVGYDGKEVILKIRYDEDRFTKDTIERMSGHLQTILKNLPGHLDTCVAELPIMTESEQHQLIIEWNDTIRDYPGNKCIHELFEKQVELTPKAAALRYEEWTLTYEELNNRANTLAHYLIKLGAGPDVPVGICMERSAEMMVGVLGILKSGSAYVPLDPDYPAERISYLVKDSGAPVILTQQNLTHVLSGSNVRVICLDAPEYLQAEKELPPINPESRAKENNLVYIIYTSGSTGQPKGVAVEHRQLTNYVYGICERMAFEPGWNYATVSTISADLGNTVVFPSWYTGGCLHVISRERLSDPDALAEYFERHHIDCLKIVPSHFAALLTGRQPQKVMPRHRLILGGEASRCEWVKNIRVLAPECQIFNHYGPTETTVGVLTYKVKDVIPRTESGTLPLGKPLPNTQIYILDSKQQPVPVGVPGEIYISGKGVARGYWQRPDLTDEKFITRRSADHADSRMYRTGDRARYLPDGAIEFLERVDYQVKIRGFRIELGEIESALKENKEIRDVRVIAREDVPGEKRIVAYIVPEKGKNPSGGDLRNHLKGKLPDYMVPSAFMILEKIPLTPNGKVDRKALTIPELAGTEMEETYMAPRTDTEKALAAIWEDILGINKIGIDDNFFALGGHSLLAVRLFVRIRKWAGIDMPLATLFKSPTVRAFAEILEAHGVKDHTSEEKILSSAANVQQWRSLVPMQTGGNLPPVFLMHAGGGNVLNYFPLLPHLASDQPVYGLQARGLDGILPPHSSLYKMAGHYISEIRSVQPSGPYFLAGASFGGTVAFEMAQQLMKQGEKTALLVLFDTIGPGEKGYRAWRTSLKSRLSRTFEDGQTRKIPIPLYIVKRIRRYLTNRIGILQCGFFTLIKHPIPLELREGYMLRKHNKAINGYRPMPYAEAISLFRGATENEWPYNDPELGWKGTATGGLKIINIDAHHLDFMDSPDLGRLFAAEVKSAQDKILKEK